MIGVRQTRSSCNRSALAAGSVRVASLNGGSGIWRFSDAGALYHSARKKARTTASSVVGAQFSSASASDGTAAGISDTVGYRAVWRLTPCA